MDPIAILQQFAVVPVILLPVALVVIGSILWVSVVARFFPSPKVEAPAAVEEPLVLIASPVETADAVDAEPETYEVEEPAGYSDYARVNGAYL